MNATVQMAKDNAHVTILEKGLGQLTTDEL